MARKLSYKILLFNERKKRIKPTHLSKAHYIEIWYGKRKILAKSRFPKTYFNRKKKASDKKKYLQDLIVRIEKKRLKAIEKRRKTIAVKKRKIAARKRKRAVRAYRKKRSVRAKEKAKKVRKTKAQKEIYKKIKSEKRRQGRRYREKAPNKNYTPKVVQPVKYDDYTKSYSEQKFFSKRQNRERNYIAVNIEENKPLMVNYDNIDEVMNTLRTRYFPHFHAFIMRQGGIAKVIPKINFDMSINNKAELEFKKDQRLIAEELGVSVERMEVDERHIKEAFEMLLEQFLAVMTGRTGKGTHHGGNYLARSQNNTVYITGFTTEAVDDLST